MRRMRESFVSNLNQVAPVATEESYFHHQGQGGGDPGETDHCAGRGRSPETKGTVEQMFRVRLFSLIPRRRVCAVV